MLCTPNHPPTPPHYKTVTHPGLKKKTLLLKLILAANTFYPKCISQTKLEVFCIGHVDVAWSGCKQVSRDKNFATGKYGLFLLLSIKKVF